MEKSLIWKREMKTNMHTNIEELTSEDIFKGQRDIPKAWSACWLCEEYRFNSEPTWSFKSNQMTPGLPEQNMGESFPQGRNLQYH